MRVEEPLLSVAAEQASVRAALDSPRIGSLLHRVFKRYGQKCYLAYENCLGEANSVDHVIPRSKGGPNYMWNLRPACKRCNVRKGDKLPAGVVYRVGQRDKETQVRTQPIALCRHFPGWVCTHSECSAKSIGHKDVKILQVA